MEWKNGNIWVYWKLGKIIVIPTNAGWKSDKTNVMGRGLALQASKEISDLSAIYGARCIQKDPYFYFKEKRLILVPSKPLDEEHPWLSWQQSSRVDTVVESLGWLQKNVDLFDIDVYVPIIGSGNGGLDKFLIKKRMNEILTDPKFIGVDYGK
jgi:hypothetical protein